MLRGSQQLQPFQLRQGHPWEQGWWIPWTMCSLVGLAPRSRAVCAESPAAPGAHGGMW